MAATALSFIQDIWKFARAAITLDSARAPDSDASDISAKRAIYQEANENENVDLVRQLNDEGMKPAVPDFSGPSPISPYMDIATKHDLLLNYLRKLAQTNRLQKKASFPQEEKWKGRVAFNEMPGSDWLAEYIQEAGLTHIKVPLKIAVVKKMKSLKMTGWQESGDLYNIDSQQIKVYSKIVERVERKFTRKEIDQFIQIIAARNFVDLHPGNIVVAKEAIYIIDTEFKSFDGYINWGDLEKFKPLISEEDQLYFWEIAEEAYKANMKKSESTTKKMHYFTLTALLKGDPDHPEKKEIKNKVSALNYIGMEKAGYNFLNPNHFSFDLKDIFLPEPQNAVLQDEEKKG